MVSLGLSASQMSKNRSDGDSGDKILKMNHFGYIHLYIQTIKKKNFGLQQELHARLRTLALVGTLWTGRRPIAGCGGSENLLMGIRKSQKKSRPALDSRPTTQLKNQNQLRSMKSRWQWFVVWGGWARLIRRAAARRHQEPSPRARPPLFLH